MSKATLRIEGFAAEPKQWISQAGKVMLDVSVAHSPRRLNRPTNEWEDELDRDGNKITLWVRATFFEDDAEVVGRQVSKGMLVELEGEPRLNAYLDGGDRPAANLELRRAKIKIIPRAAREQAPGASSGAGMSGWSEPPASTPQSGFEGGGFGDDPDAPF